MLFLIKNRHAMSLNRQWSTVAIWQWSLWISHSDILSYTPCTTQDVTAWECAEWPLGTLRYTLYSVEFAEWGLLVVPCGNSADIPAGIANWDCALTVLGLGMPQGRPAAINAAWLQWKQQWCGRHPLQARINYKFTNVTSHKHRSRHGLQKSRVTSATNQKWRVHLMHQMAAKPRIMHSECFLPSTWICSGW